MEQPAQGIAAPSQSRWRRARGLQSSINRSRIDTTQVYLRASISRRRWRPFGNSPGLRIRPQGVEAHTGFGQPCTWDFSGACGATGNATARATFLRQLSTPRVAPAAVRPESAGWGRYERMWRYAQGKRRRPRPRNCAILLGEARWSNFRAGRSHCCSRTSKARPVSSSGCARTTADCWRTTIG